MRQAEVHIKIIQAHFDAVPMSAVRPSDVRAWTAALKNEERADSYVYALYSRLSQLFTDAVHDGIVAQKPVLATHVAAWATAAVRRNGQADLGAVRRRATGGAAGHLLGAHAGLRLAEAAALRVEDVDFATGLAATPSVQWGDEPLGV